jgi:arylsulfatase A-like enzyme
VPESELHRVPWKEVPLPRLYSEDKNQLGKWLNAKPKHWRGYYEGKLWTNLESPREFVPAEMTADQIREINAMIHIENEMIDDACGRVINWLTEKNWLDNTDIFFTTDHGELQGDFGLLFKGPYHIDALMRLPFIWRPAPNAKIQSGEVTAPVGHVDLAKTFCEIAGIEPPDYCEGKPLPKSDVEANEQQRDFILTEWDSEHGPINMHQKTIYHRDGWLCTVYEKGSLYEGTEGELYDMTNDPDQLVNLWDDPAYQEMKIELGECLYASLPKAAEERLPRKAPV